MDTVFLALRVVIALGAVFGALLFAHRWITKGRPGAQPRNRQIAVVARQGLGSKAGIAVVDAGGRRYLLGVTEHAVTVLDTLGAAEAATGEPSLVTSQPIAVARFEQELRTVTIATTDMPVIVRGRPDPENPTGPITQTVSIMPAAYRPHLGSGEPVAPPAYPSRRAMRQAEQDTEQQDVQQQPARRAGALSGSVLSPTTWRQTFDALKHLR